MSLYNNLIGLSMERGLLSLVVSNQTNRLKEIDMTIKDTKEVKQLTKDKIELAIEIAKELKLKISQHLPAILASIDASYDVIDRRYN